jgi:hypothetical protein
MRCGSWREGENMRLSCWYCHKPVSSELSGGIVFRAIAVCPECVAGSIESTNHPLNMEQLAAKEKEIAELKAENERLKWENKAHSRRVYELHILA